MKQRTTPFHVQAFAGAGGSGKDYLAKALVARNPRIRVAPSFTRAAYAEYDRSKEGGTGVKSEAAGLKMPPAEFGAFQTWIYQYYLRAAGDWVRECRKDPEVDVAILARSPLDYLAYIEATVQPECYNSRILRNKAKEFCLVHNLRLVYFPHNAPWYGKDTQDGFRKVDPKKDGEFDMNLCSLMAEFKVPGTVYLDSFVLEDRITAVENALSS